MWQDQLEALMRERYPRLLAHAMLVARPTEASDLVQEALITTFTGRARFGTVAEAEAYVRRAIVSRSIDTGRRRASERRAVERLGLERPQLNELPATALAPAVERALLELPPRVRACVVLRHLEDLSLKQTAELLRLSEGAVKRYVSDGVKALSAALAVEPPAESAPVRLAGRGEEVRDA